MDLDKFTGSIFVPGYDPDIHIEEMVKLRKRCTEVDCFYIDGHVFAGNMWHWMESYVVEHPSKDFLMWMKDQDVELEFKK